MKKQINVFDFASENRFTKKLLDANPEFTINIPYGEYDKKIIGFCGTKSGHTINKIKELGLTLESPEKISVPAIKEMPLTLESKVLYSQKQDFTRIPADIQKQFYPQDVDSCFYGANKDDHIAYYAEIVSSYIIE